MASSAKKKTTFAKLNRENKLRERRREKEARKQARKQEAASQREQCGILHGREDIDRCGYPDGSAGHKRGGAVGWISHECRLRVDRGMGRLCWVSPASSRFFAAVRPCRGAVTGEALGG